MRNHPWTAARAIGLRAAWVLAALGALAAPGRCQESKPGSNDERLKKLEQQFEEFKKASEQEKAELRGIVDGLQKKLSEQSPQSQPNRALDEAIAELQVKLASTMDRQANLEAARGQTVAYLNMSFDLLTAVGTSQATDPELETVQPGGHDPKQRGFTIQNAELNLQGAVDPNFTGNANIVWQIDSAGESNVELEEAYLTTTNLPADLQVKIGQFFTEFGRINRQHPHEWAFVDQTLVNNRMFGADGLRGPGARVSWLVPTDTYLEYIAGVLNPRGETQTSFIGNDQTGVPITGSAGGQLPGALGGAPFVKSDVQNLGDMVYSQRLLTSIDLTDESTLVGGGSALFGPNASGNSGNTQIYGLDAYYKWKPLATDQGWPHFIAQTEWMTRRYKAASFNGDLDGDGINEVFNGHTFHDSGFYAQAVYGFARPWEAGVRFDYVDGDGASTGGSGSTDRRYRASPSLTYYPTEFSRIRLQSNIDKVGELGDRTFFSIWLQFEVLFGQHSAHKF